MSGVVVLNQINARIVDSNGLSVALPDGYVLTGNNLGFLVAGTDGTSAQFMRVGSDGSLYSIQSGTWTIRLQDGYGNPLTASIGNPSGLETGLITRNIPISASICTRSTVAASLTAVTILNANVNRRGASVFNDSVAAILKLALGTADVSSTNFTVEMTAGSYYEIPFDFTGRISGIWNVASGAARVSELT